MKFSKHFILIALLAVALPLDAYAKCGRALNDHSIEELPTFTGAPATGDYIPICDTSANAMKKTDASNLTLGGAFNGTVGATTPSTGAFTTLAVTTGVNTSGIVFSTALTGNPLMQSTAQTATAAQINSSYSFLASVSGKSIYPGAGFSIMASGTAASATSVAIKCQNGNIIATFPIAQLKDVTPIGPFSSAGGIIVGSALTRGCPASEGLFVSVIGSPLLVTSHLYINMPYTVQ